MGSKIKRPISTVIANGNTTAAIIQSLELCGNTEGIRCALGSCFLPKVVTASIMVVDRFLLCTAGHLDSGNATQTFSWLKTKDNLSVAMHAGGGW